MSYIHVRDRALDQESLADSHIVVKSGGNTTYAVVQAQNVTTTALVYNLQNVGPRSARIREILINPVGTITIAGDFSGFANVEALAGKIGWKAWPFNRCVDNVSHSLSGTAIEVYNTAQIIDWLTKIKSSAKLVDIYDNLQQDCCTSFSALVGTNMNPIGTYSDSGFGEGVYKKRVVGLNSLALNAGKTAITLSFNLWEPLISPYCSVNGNVQSPAIWNIGTESITLNMFNNMVDMLALSDDLQAAQTSITVALNTCNIYPKYCTSKDLQLSMDSVYQFPKFQIQTVSLNTVSAGTTATASISLNSNTLPSKFVIFARQPYNFRQPNTPDSYLQIQTVQVQLSNGSVVLNGANPKELYSISKRNGLDMTFPQWNQQNLNSVRSDLPAYGCGSVLIVDPVYDLNTWELNGLTTAQEGEYSITFTVTWKNSTGADVPNCTGFLYAVNDALLIRTDRTFVTKYLSITRDEVNSVLANKADFVSMLEYQKAQYVNSFLSGGSLTSFFKKVHGHAKKAHAFYKQNKDAIHGAVGTVSNLAKTANDLYKQYKGHGGAHQMADVAMYYQ